MLTLTNSSFCSFNGKEFDSLETSRFNQYMEITAKSKTAIKPQKPPSNWKSYLLSFLSCSSTSNTVENIDGHQCRSIRMEMKITKKVLCTNNDRPRACVKEINEFLSL